jgi:sec-independent protein translocase protein TatB
LWQSTLLWSAFATGAVGRRLANVFNLSGSEIIFLVLIALVVLGPDKLPDAMRKAGKAYADFKRMTSGFQNEMKSVLDEPMRELRETADLAKKAAMWDLNDVKPVSGSMAANEPKPATPTTPTPAATTPPVDATPTTPTVPTEATVPDSPIVPIAETNGSANHAPPPVADAANDEVASA